MPNPVKAVPPEVTDMLARIKTATTNLGTVVKSLRDAISTSMTPEDVNSVKGTLGEIATSLEGIAQDPNTPVPPGPAPVFRKKP